MRSFRDCALIDAEDPYTGELDPTRYSRSKISEDDLKDRVLGLLKNVAGTANIAGVFSAGRSPREVLFRVVD